MAKSGIDHATVAIVHKFRNQVITGKEWNKNCGSVDETTLKNIRILSTDQTSDLHEHW